MVPKKSLLATRNFKRSMGQNFLRDPKILKKIVDFARIEPTDTVVEVGPGEGGLTALLLERAKKVIAVEKDERMVELLKQKFKYQISNDKLEIICGDILLSEREILERTSAAEDTARTSERKYFSGASYKLVGNIPYYITGALFRKVFESENLPESITFVVQKEVAERIMAKPRSSNAVARSANSGFRAKNGKESILSISIKAYGEPKCGGIIKAGSFYPKPKVDSGIISVRNISREKFEKISPPPPSLKLRTDRQPPLILRGGREERFFEILKKGFAHKRKLLIKNLGVDKKIFGKCSLPEKIRAEDLKVEDWFRLAKELDTQ